MIVQGFDSLLKKDGSTGGLLQWYCAPESWPNVPAGREGYGGQWRVVNATRNDPSSSSSSSSLPKQTVLELYPPTKKDFWRRTYYQPILVKDDGPALYTELRCHDSGNNDDDDDNKPLMYTVTTTFRLTAHHQFDQAGVWIRLDAEHWIKTGIEVVDDQPRLSCVVTNVFSDWSTQPWSATSSSRIVTAESGTLTTTTTIVDCSIRIHCRGQGNFVVESRRPNADHHHHDDWEMLRICHVSRAQQQVGSATTTAEESAAIAEAFQGPCPPPGRMWVGVFGCCPVQQPGDTKVVFTQFDVQQGSDFDHNADDNFEK